MKLNKSFFIAAALVGAMATSCSEDGVWDAAPSDGVAYSFNATSSSYTYSPEDVMEDINIVVTRNTTNGAVALPITAVSSDPELVVAAEEVVFEDGASTANCILQVLRQFEIGEEATVALTIGAEEYGIAPVEAPVKPVEPQAEEYPNEEDFDAAYEAYLKELEAYNEASVDYNTYLKKLANYKRSATVKIMKDYNWISLGMGTFADTWMFDDSYRVEIQQANENPSIFRLVHPYDEGLEAEGYSPDNVAEGPSPYVKFQILKAGDELRGVTLQNDGLVYYDQFRTGFLNPSYGAEVWCVHPSSFTSKTTEESWANNTVKSYQENGLPAVVQLAPFYYMFNVGGWDYSIYENVITITFPGVRIYDYASEIAYAGRYIDADNVEYVLANVALGADVQKARVVIVAGNNNISGAEAGMLDGSLEYVEIAEGGQVQIPMLENAASGKYTVALFVYGDDGEIAGADAATFEYVGAGASPWVSLGIGYYTDDFVLPLYTEDGMTYTYEVEIEESTETPGLYRMVNAYKPLAEFVKMVGGDVKYRDTDIEINAEDADGVYFLEQSAGINLFDDGEISIVSEGGYYVEEYGYDVVKSQAPDLLGVLKDGIITLPSFYVEDYGIYYQGYCGIGGNLYYAGPNRAFTLILPSAAEGVKAKAKAKAKATEFAMAMNAANRKAANKRLSFKRLLKGNTHINPRKF